MGAKTVNNIYMNVSLDMDNINSYTEKVKDLVKLLEQAKTLAEELACLEVEIKIT